MTSEIKCSSASDRAHPEWPSANQKTWIGLPQEAGLVEWGLLIVGILSVMSRYWRLLFPAVLIVEKLLTFSAILTHNSAIWPNFQYGQFGNQERKRTSQLCSFTNFPRLATLQMNNSIRNSLACRTQWAVQYCADSPGGRALRGHCARLMMRLRFNPKMENTVVSWLRTTVTQDTAHMQDIFLYVAKEVNPRMTAASVENERSAAFPVRLGFYYCPLFSFYFDSVDCRTMLLHGSLALPLNKSRVMQVMQLLTSTDLNTCLKLWLNLKALNIDLFLTKISVCSQFPKLQLCRRLPGGGETASLPDLWPGSEGVSAADEHLGQSRAD